MRFPKFSSKRSMVSRYRAKIRSRIRRHPFAERKTIRAQLKTPGKSYDNGKGKYSKIMGMKLDQNRAKVGLKPKYVKPVKDKIGTRYKRYKSYVRKVTGNKFIQKALLLGGGTVAVMLVMGKGNISAGADTLGDLAESLMELATTLGGVSGSIVRGLTTLVSAGATGMEWLSENLEMVLLVCGCLVGYKLLT